MRAKLIFILCVAMLLASCRNATGNIERTTDTVVDDYGRTVAVPHSPKRVVSTSPAITEIIFALGGEKLLVGRTEFCTYPPETEKITNIGGISNLNVENIVALNPDIVISGSMIPQKSIDQLHNMGIATVCVIEKQRFDGLYENISRIGALIGLESKADSLNQCLHAEAEKYSQSDASQSKPSVYYVVGFGSMGNFTAGGQSFINDIIEMAGCENVAKDIEGWNYSIENLMERDPEYILIRREDSASFCNTYPYKRLSAVREGRVVGINSGMIDLQVPRNFDAIRYIRSRIHKD